MIDHIGVNVSDLAKSKAFYTQTLAALGYELLMEFGDMAAGFGTKGVPFFLKGMVRGKFPQEPGEWVLLDWKGRFAKAYEWVEGESNILVFDAGGALVHQTHGTEVVAAQVERVCSELRALLREE